MNENEQGGASSRALESNASRAMARAKRVHARMWLIQQFHLESAFIGVPKLAIILGVSPSALWGYIREGKFFMPYRMFNKSPVVCIDDLVEWYCGPEGSFADLDAAIPELPPTPAAADRPEALESIEIEQAVARALASIGIDPRSKPGSLRRR